MLKIVLIFVENLTKTFKVMDFEYRIENNEVIITGTKNRLIDSAVIEIPKEINGCKVINIGDYAFNLYTDITQVILPDSIKRIGIESFTNCSLLKSINIPNSVTNIDRNAFVGCKELIKINGIITKNKKNIIINDRFIYVCGYTYKIRYKIGCDYGLNNYFKIGKKEMKF